MGYVIDLIIVCMFGLIVFSAVKNGFVKSFINSISLIVAIVVTLSFFAPLKAELLKTDIAAKTDASITEKLTEICPKGDSFDSDKLIKDKPDEFIALLDKYGIDVESLTDKYDEWVSEGVDNITQSVVSFISGNAISLLASALSFLILFFGTLLAMKIIAAVVDKIFRLPVLKTANKILGFVFGVACGILAVCAFTAAVSMLMPYLATVGIEIDAENTFIFKYLWGEGNILLKILA